MVYFYIRKQSIMITTAEVYPDHQLSSTSAATTSVTTIKKPSTRQYQKPNRIACNTTAYNFKFC